MPRSLSPAQRAVQITFVLKGHLKNMQLAYLRAAALLARMRDEKLYRALKHESLEDYADVRLGLQRAALYRSHTQGPGCVGASPSSTRILARD